MDGQRSLKKRSVTYGTHDMLFLDSARRRKAAALHVCAKSGVSRR